MTRDDGKSWANVTPTGLPPGGRVQNLEPGTHNPGTAYAAIYLSPEPLGAAEIGELAAA